MVSPNELVEDWVKHKCPRDCPFNKRLGDLRTRYCNFAVYADVLEPGRKSRTEIDADGNVDYHIWPDCDIYKKYKKLGVLVDEVTRQGKVKHRIKSEPVLVTTARKHPATSKHKGEF